MATTKAEDVLVRLRPPPIPPNVLDAVTERCSVALPVGSLLATAGVSVATALIRADKSELEGASAVPPTA